ncbi:MAG: RNA polymerase sigma factor [Acutalibacteraceae bacterium]
MNSFGTDEYIEETVKKYSPSMLRTAFSVVRNTHDAEDAVQETFLKLVRLKPSFHDETHEKAWLLRVTINNAKNIRRSYGREGTSLDENQPFVYTESTDVLNEVLSLPEKYRVVIHLYYYEGYSIKEIAEILNKPAATVGTLLSRGRKMLKTFLKG